MYIGLQRKSGSISNRYPHLLVCSCVPRASRQFLNTSLYVSVTVSSTSSIRSREQLHAFSGSPTIQYRFVDIVCSDDISFLAVLLNPTEKHRFKTWLGQSFQSSLSFLWFNHFLINQSRTTKRPPENQHNCHVRS